MKVFLVRSKGGISAVGDYNTETKELVVFKGSIVSETISYTNRFRGATSINKRREVYVRDRMVIKDVSFRSASTAANFVTGSSTNGLTAWKTESGMKLKDAVVK